MKTTGSPFAFLNGQPFVVVNFTLDIALGAPPLVDQLKDLLGQVSGEDILLLRRLTEPEARLLAERTQDAEHEAWAVISARFKRKE